MIDDVDILLGMDVNEAKRHLHKNDLNYKIKYYNISSRLDNSIDLVKAERVIRVKELDSFTELTVAVFRDSSVTY